MFTHWINGNTVAESGDAIPVVNPATEQVIDSIPCGSAETAERAADAARQAFKAWSGLTVVERRNAIRTAIDKFIAIREEVAHLLTCEMGKPIAQARGEVNAAIDTMRSFCELVVHLRAGSQMSGANELNFQHRMPRGVAACIIPWNFPIAVGIENVVPNLLVGNTVVWKPSEKTPLSSRLLVEKIFDHLPPGVLNLVLGDGKNVGEPLVTSPQVDLVVFVGSERTGRRIGGLCGQGLKKVILELGGKDPLIVDETVNVKAAARLAAEATFFNAGQICTSTERLYIAESIFEPFVEALVKESNALRVGDGLDQDTQMGPLVDHLQLETVSRQVMDAKSRGAVVNCGGNQLQRPGFFYPPTVLTNLEPNAVMNREETFGPVAPCSPFRDFDEAIHLANQGQYGLAAIVCTTSAPRAMKAIQELQVGMVKINAMRGKAPGGTSEPARSSGLGHGYGVEFLAEITRQKSVHWRHDLPGS
jgi:acyl-CoA reductase-like NAD-dependent aldehyde dehydrogenase